MATTPAAPVNPNASLADLAYTPGGMGSLSRRSSEDDLNRFNQAMRQSPVYLDFMRRNGLPTDGRVQLSRQQQSALEQELRRNGIPITEGMHIDQGGNLNQKNRTGTRIATAAAITGAAFGGAAALGAFAPAAGGGAAAAGGAGAGAASGAGAGLGTAALGGTGAALTPFAATVPMVSSATLGTAALGGTGASLAPLAAPAVMHGAGAGGGAAMAVGPWDFVKNIGGPAIQTGGQIYTSGRAAKAGREALDKQLAAEAEAARIAKETADANRTWLIEQDKLMRQERLELENRRRFEYERTEGEKRAQYEALEAQRAPYRGGSEGVLSQWSTDLGIPFAPSQQTARYVPSEYKPLYDLNGKEFTATDPSAPIPKTGYFDPVTGQPIPRAGGVPSTTMPVRAPSPSMASSILPAGAGPMSNLAAPVAPRGQPEAPGGFDPTFNARAMPQRRRMTPRDAYLSYLQQGRGVA